MSAAPPPPAMPSADREEFRPGVFARRLARRYWTLLAVIMVCMGSYSAFTVLRLGAIGLVTDVTFHLVKGREAPPGQKVEKGAMLESFERNWRKFLGGEPPTSRLEVPSRFYRFLGVLVAAAVVLALIMGISFFLKELLAQRLVLRIIADVRQAIVDRLVTQSLGFFHHQRAGDLLSRVTNDVISLNVTLRLLFETLVQEPIVILSCIGAAFAISWWLTLGVLPLYVLLFIPIFRSGRKVKRYGKRSLEKLGEVTEDLQQLFTGIRTVKAFGMEHHERRDFEAKNSAYVRKTLKMARARITGRTLQEMSYNVGTALLLLACGWLLYSGTAKLSAGLFAAFLAAMVQIYQPVKAISKAWNQLQESKGGYDRILELLRSRSRIIDSPGARDFPGVKEGIRFDRLSFTYDGVDPFAATAPAPSGAAEGNGASGNGAEPVLRDINFEAKVGEVLAIVGPSGAGKSTLVDLLARFYDPTDGRILADGVDIRDYRQAAWLASVAIVSQDPFLFNATIEENIAYGRAGATRAEVEAAARKAFAHEFILEQPQGYATRIGERGVMLSGGQRQRLTIARAILKDAPILILDEATSSLDSAAEKEVQRALENLMAHRTTFIIAHRLSTITHADRILVLSEGRIVEEGSHEELLVRQGVYWGLCRLQNPGAAGPS